MGNAKNGFSLASSFLDEFSLFGSRTHDPLDFVPAFPTELIEACYPQENGQTFNILIRIFPDTELVTVMAQGPGPDSNFSRCFYFDLILEFGGPALFDLPRNVRLRPSRNLANKVSTDKCDLF